MLSSRKNLIHFIWKFHSACAGNRVGSAKVCSVSRCTTFYSGEYVNLVETSVLCDSKTSVRNQICFCCLHSPDMQDSFFSFLFFFSFVKHKFIGLYRFINSIHSIFKIPPVARGKLVVRINFVIKYACFIDSIRICFRSVITSDHYCTWRRFRKVILGTKRERYI